MQLLIYLSYVPQDCMHVEGKDNLIFTVVDLKKSCHLMLFKSINMKDKKMSAKKSSNFSKSCNQFVAEKGIESRSLDFQVNLFLASLLLSWNFSINSLHPSSCLELNSTNKYLFLLFLFFFLSFFCLSFLTCSSNLGNLKVFLVLLSVECIHVMPFYVLVQFLSEG